MAVSELEAPATSNSAPPARSSWPAIVYRAIAYPGLVSVFAALLFGFRHSAAAGAINYLYNLLLYAAFVAPHLVMTRRLYKQAVWGNPHGSLRERQVYILVTIVTWAALLAWHWPLPGFDYVLPTAVRFAGTIGFLLSVLLFYEGFTFASIDSLLGVPGSQLSHTHGAETPLFVEGQYAQVRHPMYRAAIFLGLSSLLIHTSAAQLFWAVLTGITFIAFIPVEEAQLIEARGDDYRDYMRRVPYRLFRGIW